jgi:hypothetical protein
MKIHQQKNKLNVVMDREDLLSIAVCLSESKVLKNRMLALQIKQEMDKLNQKGQK